MGRANWSGAPTMAKARIAANYAIDKITEDQAGVLNLKSAECWVDEKRHWELCERRESASGDGINTRKQTVVRSNIANTSFRISNFDDMTECCP